MEPHAGVGRLLEEPELDDAFQGRYSSYRSTFAVSSSHLVTAFHCVETVKEQLWAQLPGTLDDPSDRDHFTLLPVLVDLALQPIDIAVLRRDPSQLGFVHRSGNSNRLYLSSRDSGRVLRRRALTFPSLGSVRAGRAVQIAGFPAPTELRDRKPQTSGSRPQAGSRILAGTIETVDATVRWRGHPSAALEVFSPSLAAGEAVSASGFSGGPVVRRNTRRVVGVVTSFRPGLRAENAATGGTVCAVRQREFLRAIPRTLLPTLIGPRIAAGVGAALATLLVLIVGGVVINAGPPNLPVPPVGSTVPAVVLPGCVPPADSLPVSPGDVYYDMGTTAPKSTIPISPNGRIEQPFVARGSSISTVEVWVASNTTTRSAFMVEIVDPSTSRALWSSSGAVDASNSNGIIPVDQPTPLRVATIQSKIYLLRVTNTSDADIALFAGSQKEGTTVLYVHAGCVVRGPGARAISTPNSQFLSARITGT